MLNAMRMICTKCHRASNGVSGPSAWRIRQGIMGFNAWMVLVMRQLWPKKKYKRIQDEYVVSVCIYGEVKFRKQR